MAIDFDALSLTDMIQLQTQLASELKRRFEKRLALVFSDVVGSTQYFARFGDVAGRALQQRHLDLLRQSLGAEGGRIVDTAGDGAFTVFPSVENAVAAMSQVQELITAQNASHARDHQLVIRVGLHWGQVLTDGTLVSGDSVNLCSRVAGTCNPGDIRLTRAAFLELEPAKRLRCHGLPQVALKGISEPVEILRFEWRDTTRFPVRVRIRETGDEIPLPLQDLIAFGRLREQNGILANDVVLTLPDPYLAQQVSRWQFELRRRTDGFVLRAVSEQPNWVDGELVPKGAEVAIRPGSVVQVAKVMTLDFLGDNSLDSGKTGMGDATLFPIMR
ncbi:MAG: adenylate/guanylate cyclase domain-containing protein [Deltaproteobacteria bacterium]|nr:adenylate/guanylate cyclase domain-containing protein [Deltaproteobacteria bacterium]